LLGKKKFSQSFNNDLKQVPWSAYGFNWHNKGFHYHLRKFIPYTNITEYDAKFWDKRFPLKEECYNLRRKFLDLDEEEESEFWKIALDEIYPNIILPTSEVIILPSGQCSGSENTTSDNTIGHMMIIFYEAISGFYDINKIVPSIDDILSNVENIIYSDDVIQACSDEYSFMADPYKKKAIFEKFGLGIDPLDPEKFKKFNSIYGATFLGMTVSSYDQYLVPIYDYSKVLNSTVIRKEDETPQQQVVRFEALLSLLIFTPYYTIYRTFICEYARRFSINISLKSHDEARRYELNTDF